MPNRTLQKWRRAPTGSPRCIAANLERIRVVCDEMQAPSEVFAEYAGLAGV
jgi:hypothetical protein